MRDTLKEKDVTVKTNGQGYILTIGKREPEKLSPYEAEELFCQLLKTLPGIQERIALAWDQRHDPWIKLIGYYGLGEGDELVINRWKGEVYVGEELTFYTAGFMQKDEVVKVLREMYGKELIVRKEVSYEASRKMAVKEKVLKQATAYAKSKGVTLEDLWAEVAKLKGAGQL